MIVAKIALTIRVLMNVNNSILYLLGLVSSPKGVCFPSFGRPAGGKYQINYLARERKVARSLVKIIS